MEPKKIWTIAGIVAGAFVILKVVSMLSVSHQVHLAQEQAAEQQRVAIERQAAARTAQQTATASQPTPAFQSAPHHTTSQERRAKQSRPKAARPTNLDEAMMCCQGLSQPYLNQCSHAMQQVWFGSMPRDMKEKAAADYCISFKSTAERAKIYRGY